MEKSSALKSKVRSALVYPIFIFIIGSGVLLFMMTYVIPKITKIFEANQKALPLSTTILITISKFLSDHFIVTLIVAFIAAFIVARFIKSNRGKRLTDNLVLKLPLFGKLVSKIAISRFSRTIGTLVGSGIPLLNALEISQAVIGNTVFVDSLEKVKDSVREGSSLATPVQNSKVFPACYKNDQRG